MHPAAGAARTAPRCSPTRCRPSDEKLRATQRLVRYARTRSLKYTFAEIGREAGLSDRSIRHIVDDLVRDLDTQFEFVTPRYHGIDEVKLIGKYRCILTIVEANTVYNML